MKEIDYLSIGTVDIDKVKDPGITNVVEDLNNKLSKLMKVQITVTGDGNSNTLSGHHKYVSFLIILD